MMLQIYIPHIKIFLLHLRTEIVRKEGYLYDITIHFLYFVCMPQLVFVDC
jgi:hypothetical protein